MNSRRTLQAPLLMAYLFCGSALANAATYYIGPSGSDANSGTQIQPWLTLQKGLNSVAPGDTLNILSGNYYDSSTNYTVIDGTSNSPITIQGQSGTWLRYTNNVTVDNHDGTTSLALLPVLRVVNSWYIVRGLNMNRTYVALYGTGSMHNLCESNWLERSRAITFDGSPMPYTNGPSFNIVRLNVFTNMTYCVASMGVQGHDNLIESNIWWTSNDNDAIDFFGVSNVFRGNLMVNVGPSAQHTGNHVDMFQTFGDWGQEAHWITIEGNVVSNCAGHFFMAGPLGAGNTNSELNSDIMVRNNLIIGGSGDSFCYAPRVQFLNNTFWNPQSGVASIYIAGNDQSGWARNCVVLNNIIAESTCNGPLAVDAWMTNVTVCDYNFVSRVGGASQVNTYGTHGFNGGYAGFVNANAGSLNLHLAANSVCIGMGTNLTALGLPGLNVDMDGKPRPASGSWDIGAYQYYNMPKTLKMFHVR